MKRMIASLLGLSLVLISCSSPIQTVTPTLQTDPFNTPWEDRSIFKSGLVEAEQPMLEELGSASVYHIEFDIASDLYHVSGHQEVQYTNTETVPLNEIVFRLFRVSSWCVSLGFSSCPLPAVQDPGNPRRDAATHRPPPP